MGACAQLQESRRCDATRTRTHLAQCDAALAWQTTLATAFSGCAGSTSAVDDWLRSVWVHFSLKNAQVQ